MLEPQHERVVDFTSFSSILLIDFCRSFFSSSVGGGSTALDEKIGLSSRCKLKRSSYIKSKIYLINTLASTVLLSNQSSKDMLVIQI